MNPDLYAAWYTAGDRLQSVGAWLAVNWLWLASAAALAVFAVWAIRHTVHAGRRRGIRRLEQYANHPGSRAVLDDFHQPRKEKPQP